LGLPHGNLIRTLIYLYGQQGQVEKAFQIALTEEKGGMSSWVSMSLGIGSSSAALAEIILEHDVPLNQVETLCQSLMAKGGTGGHSLLAWAYTQKGDLDAAKSLYAQIGAPWEQDWWVVGPFDGDVYVLDDVLPPEGDVHLNQTYDGAVGPVRWKRVDDGYLNGAVEFTKALDWPEEQVINANVGEHIYPKAFPGRGFMKPYSSRRWIAYALIYVESNRPQDVALELSVDIEFKWKLWFNDTSVFRRDEVEDVISPIQLQKGLNKILVKLVQHENRGFHFSLRITDSDGNPIPDLKFVSADEVLGKQ
jgi:hypothetical protein